MRAAARAAEPAPDATAAPAQDVPVAPAASQSPPRPPGATRLAELALRVLGADRAPVADAYVEIQGDGYAPRFARTDADGRVRFGDVPDAPLVVRAGGASRMLRRPGEIDIAATVTAARRAQPGVLPTVPESSTRVVCVVDYTQAGIAPGSRWDTDFALVGAPRAGDDDPHIVPMRASVDLDAARDPKAAQGGTPPADRRISEPVPVGSTWTLVARARGLRSAADGTGLERFVAWAVVRDVVAPTKGLTVAPTPGRVVRGRVDPVQPLRAWMRVLSWPEVAGRGFANEGSVALDGTFAVAAPLESVVVAAGIDGHGFMSYAPVVVGTATPDVVLALVEVPEFRGRLLFEDGAPVTMGRVQIGQIEERVDGQGRFRFPHLLPGRRTLTYLWLQDVVIDAGTVDVPGIGEAEVVLRLPSGGR